MRFFGACYQLLPILPYFITKPAARRCSLEFRVNQSWQTVYYSAVQVLWILALGVLVLHFLEGLSWIDSLYCACVTVTTVGFGDESFSSFYGRLFGVRISYFLLFTLCVYDPRFLTLMALVSDFLDSGKHDPSGSFFSDHR